jgi:hypothetical protein
LVVNYLFDNCTGSLDRQRHDAPEFSLRSGGGNCAGTSRNAGEANIIGTLAAAPALAT